MTSPAPANAFAPHNHATCRKTRLRDVETICAAQKLKLTPIRKRVLEILLEAHQAVRAYDILDRLSAEGLGSKPPTVYRALDFLYEHGFVHRIQHLNAFIACAHPEPEHTPAFLICTECDGIAETTDPALRRSVETAARKLDFAVSRVVIEASGVCPSCRAGAAS